MVNPFANWSNLWNPNEPSSFEDHQNPVKLFTAFVFQQVSDPFFFFFFSFSFFVIIKWNVHLGKSTDSSISDNKAFIARRGETIDATIESHIYQVRLKDSLLSSLKFGKTRDAEVAWIDARLTYQVITTKQPKLLIEPFCYHPLKFWFIGRRFAGLGWYGK